MNSQKSKKFLKQLSMMVLLAACAVGSLESQGAPQRAAEQSAPVADLRAELDTQDLVFLWPNELSYNSIALSEVQSAGFSSANIRAILESYKMPENSYATVYTASPMPAGGGVAAPAKPTLVAVPVEWKISGIRFGCVDVSNCSEPAVMIVVQPWRTNGGVDNLWMELQFKLGQDLPMALGQIMSIKNLMSGRAGISTQYMPVGVHPGLRHEAYRSSIRSSMIAIARNAMTLDKLSRILIADYRMGTNGKANDLFVGTTTRYDGTSIQYTGSVRVGAPNKSSLGGSWGSSSFIGTPVLSGYLARTADSSGMISMGYVGGGNVLGASVLDDATAFLTVARGNTSICSVSISKLQACAASVAPQACTAQACGNNRQLGSSGRVLSCTVKTDQQPAFVAQGGGAQQAPMPAPVVVSSDIQLVLSSQSGGRDAFYNIISDGQIVAELVPQSASDSLGANGVQLSSGSNRFSLARNTMKVARQKEERSSGKQAGVNYNSIVTSGGSGLIPKSFGQVRHYSTTEFTSDTSLYGNVSVYSGAKSVSGSASCHW